MPFNKHRRFVLLVNSIYYRYTNNALKLWKDVFQANAKIYNGLYSGIQRIYDGQSRNPDKPFREWCQRTQYKLPDSIASTFCKAVLLPTIRRNKRRSYHKWADLLLKAAAQAGVSQDIGNVLMINETNVGAYIEWDGKDIFVGDTIYIIHSAWYQHGLILEQGYCNLQEIVTCNTTSLENAMKS